MADDDDARADSTKRFRPDADGPLSTVRVCAPSLLSGAFPVLARWHREQVRTGAAAPLPAGTRGGPRSMLCQIASSAEGRAFLRRCVDRFESEAAKAQDPIDGAQALGTAASLAWANGELERAWHNLTGAICACEESGDLDALAELRSLQLRLGRQRELDAQRRAGLRAPRPPRLRVHEVERVDPRALSVAAFQERYARPGTPVVLVGLAREVVRDCPFEWSIGEWARVARAHGSDHDAHPALGAALRTPIVLKRRARGSVEWARMEDDDDARTQPPGGGERGRAAPTLADAVLGCAEGDASWTGYLFDWSLPLNCPSLLEGVRIPRYFASDALQACASGGALYRETWPSLFLGPAGSSCGLHVDTFGSNFWCALLDGTKRWAFFPREQLGLLGASLVHSQDPVLDEAADALASALADVPVAQLCADEGWAAWPGVEGTPPALERVSPLVCELRAGDVLFVPAGMPHAVANVGGAPALSLSANYVDASNARDALRELEAAATTDPRAGALLSELRRNVDDGGASPAVPRGRLAAVYEIGEHVPYATFKRGDPSDGGRWPLVGSAGDDSLKSLC